MEWGDWRQVAAVVDGVGSVLFIVGLCLFPLCQGECLLPNLIGKFYDQQQHCDVVFQLQDGSTVQVSGMVGIIGLVKYLFLRPTR